MKHLLLAAALILGLLSPSAASAQINVKDSVQTILQNDTLAANERYRAAHNLIFYNSPPEEAERLVFDIFYPFIKQHWKNESEQLAYLSRLYLLISLCHRERGGDDRIEQERLFCLKSLETAVASGDDAVCARSYMANGFRETGRGDTKLAHKYLYQAIFHYDKLEQYTKVSEMLYAIVANFWDIKDLEGMRRVLRQMEEYLEKDASKQSLYQYNVIKLLYFEVLLEKAKAANQPTDYHLVDSMMLHIKSNIELVENHLGELDPNWVQGWTYYYMARALDGYYPDQNDTILSYLDKAIDMLEGHWISRVTEPSAAKELEAVVSVLRGKALYRKGQEQEAYRCMNEALACFDYVKDFRNVERLRSEAHQFMADYYEKINRPDEALKFQKRLRESEAKRYENEKVQAINDMAAKYETEKKELQISGLIKQRRILWLLIGLTAAMLLVSILLVVLSRLKRKNVVQQLYETALLAELHQQELEKLQSAQQQLERHPVQNTIENIAHIISGSIIDKDDKKVYLERLAGLDSKLLEGAYQTSNVKITGMDMKYIICFAADMDVKDIGLLFNIEPASVHTVRYRIRKKFAKEDVFRMILSYWRNIILSVNE